MQGLGVFNGFGEAYADTMTGGSRGSKGAKKNSDEDPNFTTVMLRNIPNKYTRTMLIDQLHKAGFRGDIDYLYLPVDFANRCNVGYCFLNFRTAGARQRFYGPFDGIAALSCLPGFNSYKVCQVTRAKWQGREENIRRLRSGPELMMQLAAHPEWLPLILDEEGNQEPFLVDDPSAPRGPAAPRRQMKGKRGQQGMLGFPFGVGAMDGMGMMPDYLDAQCFGGCSRGKGGKGGKGKGRTCGGKGPMPGMMGRFRDPAAAYGGAGGPMMPVPVMTEQGLQYMPYDGAYEGAAGGYLVMNYAGMGHDQQLYPMPYAAGYGGYPAWAGYGGFHDEVAAYKGYMGGKGASGSRPHQGLQDEDDEEEEDDEDEDGLLQAM